MACGAAKSIKKKKKELKVCEGALKEPERQGLGEQGEKEEKGGLRRC